jgi:protein-S-isoprenylcysteine O-methyltransferase Ste14
VLLIVLAVLLGVYVYRIETEEEMLAGSYPDYREYRKQTWRLMPFVY